MRHIPVIERIRESPVSQKLLSFPRQERLYASAPNTCALYASVSAEKSIHVTTHTYLRDVRKIIRLTESGEIYTLSHSHIRLCKHNRQTHTVTKAVYARNTIRLAVASVGLPKNSFLCE